MVRVAEVAQTVHAPVVVGGEAVERHGAGDQAERAAAGGRFDEQRLVGFGLRVVGAGVGDAQAVQRGGEPLDALGALVPGVVGGVCAGRVADAGRGIGDFGRDVEDRVAGVGAAALGDGGFELAYGDVRFLDVPAHRFEQRVEVEGGAVGGGGVRAFEVHPQFGVEEQVAVDQHGDAVVVRAVGGIAGVLDHRGRHGRLAFQRHRGRPLVCRFGAVGLGEHEPCGDAGQAGHQQSQRRDPSCGGVRIPAHMPAISFLRHSSLPMPLVSRASQTARIPSLPVCDGHCTPLTSAAATSAAAKPRRTPHASLRHTVKHRDGWHANPDDTTMCHGDGWTMAYLRLRLRDCRHGCHRISDDIPSCSRVEVRRDEAQRDAGLP